MPASCSHCGLPLRGSRISLDTETGRLGFCCLGCKVAHQALAVAGANRDAIIDGEVDESPAKSKEGGGGVEEWKFLVEGMVCEACAPIVRKVLEKTGGVAGSRVNFITGKVVVSHDPELASRGRITRRLARFGYQVVETGAAAEQARNASTLIRVSLGLFLAVDVMMLSLPEYLGAFAPGEEGPARMLRIAMALLCLPILSWVARPVFGRALAALTSFHLDLNFMVALGALAAYGYSLYGLFSGGPHVYFETAAFLPTLILLGKSVEERARIKAREALTGLSDELPASAVVERGGEVIEVPPETLLPGEVVRLSGAGRSPCDGVVLDGELVVDESLVSGESGRRRRGPGEVVRAGVMCLGGEARLEVASALEDSLLANVVSSLERAEVFRGPRRLALDRVVRWMAPGVIVLSALAFGASWFGGGGFEASMLRAMAVTLFACPCALGLAVPLARAVAIGRAAELGVVTRDGEALETAGRPDHLLMDKTGTLTRGAPELVEFYSSPGGGDDREGLLSVAAALEAGSTHPLAEAVRLKAESLGVEPVKGEDIAEIAGMGVAGYVDGGDWIFGAARMMEERGAKLPDWARKSSAKLLATGASVSFLAAREGTGWEIESVFGFDDLARPEMAGVLSRLREAGIEITMATGDNPDAAAKVARVLGIGDVRADLTPEDKRDLVLDLRRSGKTVWFVGDGVNDAPALAVSDLGVAMGRGARIAAEAGAVTLAGERLSLIPDIIELADRLSRIVRQNLVWAAAYNLAGLPLAFIGLLSPVLSALAMMASSLSVTLNSLRRSGKEDE